MSSHLYSLGWLHLNTHIMTNFGEDVEKLEPSYIAGENVILTHLNFKINTKLQ